MFNTNTAFMKEILPLELPEVCHTDEAQVDMSLDHVGV